MYRNNEAVRAMAQPIIDHQNDPADLMSAHWATSLMATVWATTEPWDSLSTVAGKVTALWPDAPLNVVVLVLDAWSQYRDLPADHFTGLGNPIPQGDGDTVVLVEEES